MGVLNKVLCRNALFRRSHLKGTPFVGRLNGTPFTYLVQNFLSLFTAVDVLSFKYE